MMRTLNGCLIRHFINRLIKTDDRREYRMAVNFCILSLCKRRIFFKNICRLRCAQIQAARTFGGSRTSPLQERKQSQIAAFLLALLTKVRLRYF